MDDITKKSEVFFDLQWKRYNSMSDITCHDNLEQHLLRATNSNHEDWKNKKVFEVGAGSGRNTLAALKLGVQSIVATELSIGGTKAVTKNTENYRQNCYVYQCNGCDLSREEDNSFDIVFSVNCLCHIPNYKLAIAEMVRICKPNGLIMFNSATQFPEPKRKLNILMRKYTTQFCEKDVKLFAEMIVALRRDPDFWKANKSILPLSDNELSAHDNFCLPYFDFTWTIESLTKLMEELNCKIEKINDFIAVKARKNG